MGAKACRGIGGEDNRWHANKILWDCSEKKELSLTAGEEVHKSWSEVEDCVGGKKGVLYLTTLRFIWQADANAVDRPNISAGFKTVQSVQFNVHDSHGYGRTRVLSILTRWSNETYEFTFALTPQDINDAFYTFEAWHKRFKGSRVFRETLVREMKMTKSAVGVVTYYPERIIREIPRVENVAATKKYNGKLILTTHRMIWVSSRSAIVNISIPFIELRMISTRNTPFGLGLVVCATNISLSNKNCHLKQGLREADDTIVIGLRLSSIALVNEVYRFCTQKQKDFSESPFYMPLDGRVIHRLGRWMVVDEDTWMQEMGMNDNSEDVDDDDSPFQPSTVQLQLPVSSMSGDLEEVGDEYDDPLTPHATPVRQFDLGQDGELLHDLAELVADPMSSNDTAHTTASNNSENHKRTQLRKAQTGTVPTSPAAAAYRVDPTCVICLTKPPQLAFDPCGHMCSCKHCGENLKECPMCRQPIDKTLKVFVVA